MAQQTLLRAGAGNPEQGINSTRAPGRAASGCPSPRAFATYAAPRLSSLRRRLISIMRTITALAAAAALSMASADLQCTITNVTAGVVKIDQHGSTHYGGHASCSYTFAGKVTSVTKIEGNHCDSCTQVSPTLSCETRTCTRARAETPTLSPVRRRATTL